MMGDRDAQLMPLGLCAANGIISYVHIQGQAAPYIGYLEPWEADALLAIMSPKYLQEPVVNNLPHYDPHRADLARTAYATIEAAYDGYDIEELGGVLKPRPRMREGIKPPEVEGERIAPFHAGGTMGPLP